MKKIKNKNKKPSRNKYAIIPKISIARQKYIKKFRMKKLKEANIKHAA